MEDSDDEANERSVQVTSSPERDDIIKLLECPVCFELMFPPIRSCQRGHIICNYCATRVTKCPLCQTDIEIGRNFFAEDFVNNSMMKCKYSEDGCLLELPGAKIQRHFLQCQYRPLKCTYCSLKVLYANYDQHLSIEHGIGRWDLNDEGSRIVLDAKLRRKSDGNATINEHSTFSNKLMKSLLVALILSFFADNILCPTLFHDEFPLTNMLMRFYDF